MATPDDFRTVRAAVVATNSYLRADMRLALLQKGIREPATCRTADAFLEIAGRDNLDLIVCDSSAFGEGFAPVIQRIRRDTLGGNPFAVVIATLDDASHDRVRTALDSGIDDLICRPAPAKRFSDRIDLFVADRKPFIATRNYVGPVRSTVARSGDGAGELIMVPNTLRRRVVDKISDTMLRREVARATAKLKERIADRPLAPLDRMIRRALAWHGRDKETLRRDFGNLQALGLEIGGYYRDSADGHIADLALALSKLAKRIAQRDPPDPRPSDFDLLRNLGAVVRRAMAADGESMAAVHEIAAMVDRYCAAASPKGEPRPAPAIH